MGCLADVQAQQFPGVFYARSVSGQFFVQSARALGVSPLVSYLENDTNFIRLDPVLLPVSCERIKQALWRELQVSGPWKGKIFIKLYPTTSADDPITIESEHFRDGWQYGLSIPTITDRQRYIRAMVSVLLSELANREAHERGAEIPAWLVEGLSREIWEADARELILPPPQFSGTGLRLSTLFVNAREQNPLNQAHEELRSATPLSFQQLSWPTRQEIESDRGEPFRSSAQVFVHQLLNLPDGPACMRTMLEQLPRYYNWQFAFLGAFHNTFQRPLDVEKWWSLQLVHFTGRELADSWPAQQSWEKLDELVRSAVQIRVFTNELPLHTEIKLQTIIRDWPPDRQSPALEMKVRELQMLRPRLAPDLAGLVDQYCQVIEAYLGNLNHHGMVLPFRKHALLRRSAEEALQRLDQLDLRREALRPAVKPTTTLQADLRPVDARR